MATKLDKGGKVWVRLGIKGRVNFCKLAGLPGRLGSKPYKNLHKVDREALRLCIDRLEILAEDLGYG